MALLSLPLWAANDFDIEHVKHFKLFRQLYDSGPDEEFYRVAADYERFLKDNGKMEAYFKIKCNEGFYDVDHYHLIRATHTAEQLDKELLQAGMSAELGYLPLGLMGDISKACHNLARAQEYYNQAILAAGDHDKKFVIEKYISQVEMVYLRDPAQALTFADKALAISETIDDIEYKAKGLALKGYVLFLNGKSEEFYKVYNGFEALRSMEHSRFSHRYDNMMLVARLAFDRNYDEAEKIATTRELNVDRSLMLVKIYSLSGNVQKGFEALTRRIIEQDSIVGSVQELNLDDMAAEMQMNKLKTESDNNKRLANRTMMALVVIVVLFVFVYVMGRRRLMLKIWARNKELIVARDRAEESDRMKSAFIRNMTHEIRTPLNAISGFSQILCTPGYELGEEELANLQERIMVNVNSITAIVNELLELSRGESEVQKSEVKPVEVCREVLTEINLKNTKGLNITLDTSLPDIFSFQCHRENLRRILSQLMENALKFTDKGSVVLECHQQGALILFTVTDTGSGIAESEREHIFENFVKLNEYKDGVGLGLSVSRRLARQMGGDVTLDTLYKQGSRFVLTLPL